VETPTNEEFRFSSIIQIEKFFERMNSISGLHKESVRIQICSNWDAPIKYAMDVVDLCDNYNIPKSLLVRKIEKPIQ